MSERYSFHPGTIPLLVSVPHDGRQIPDEIGESMTPAGLAIPDTDWHVAQLYEFANELGASMLVATYSRYVVDLNRSPEDDVLYPGQVATGLCPTRTFAGDEIYRSGAQPDAHAKRRRVREYWQPYHDRIATELERLREEHGYAVLWDAHSIPGVVPRLFEGELPELNIGTNDGMSCGPRLQQMVADAVGDYSSVVNGRFKGGYITRHYGSPADRVHAIQLEIAQRVYMNETSCAFDGSKGCRLQETLRKMLAPCTIQDTFR